MSKIKTGFLTSVAMMFVGLILRLGAPALAWQSHSGPYEEAFYGAHTEAAYREVALMLMSVGGLLLGVTFAKWLFVDHPDEHKPLA